MKLNFDLQQSITKGVHNMKNEKKAIIKVYVSEEQKKFIQADADSVGLSVSQYIVNTLKNSSFGKDTELKQNMVRELCRHTNLLKEYVIDEDTYTAFYKWEEKIWQFIK